MSRSPPSSSSTFIVPPFLLNHHLDKRMSGKGFIEPHRNNLPRRKRKIVTNTEDGADAIALEIDKTVSQILLSEAGPRSSTTELNLHDGTSPTSTDSATFAFTPTSICMCPPSIKTQIHASSSVDTNLTEPPSSFRASPRPSAPFHNSPALSNSSTIYLSHPTFKTPKRSLFHGYYLNDALPRSESPPPITPSKGHLQPTSATLPRRHRLSVAREERRRRSLAEQQRQSICAQELTKGITLGFLAEGDEHDDKVVRIIKVYDDSTTSFASAPSSSSPASISPSTLSSESHLQLTLPANSSSYTDGTTSLTDSQIRQACTFIDEHISIPLADTSSINSSTLRPGHVSVLILTPCIRPEEAMSIGISYLAGIEDMGKDVQEMKGDKANDDDDDDLNNYTYSTVHRLLMAFHDEPGSPIPDSDLKSELKEADVQLDNLRLDTCEEPTSTSCNPGRGSIITGSSRGLRPEWRGVLSFDGMQRLDKIWTSIRS